MHRISISNAQEKYLNALQKDEELCEKFGPVTWDEKFEHIIHRKFIIPVLTAKDIVFIILRRILNGAKHK